MLGSIVGSVASAALSGMFAKRQAAKQMSFQERMSGTAHQREVADLRAAGLNPILSGTGGVGASTPGGAMAQTDMASSAKIGALIDQELENLKATEENIDADTDKKIEDKKKTRGGRLADLFGTGTYEEFSKQVETFEESMLDLFNSGAESLQELFDLMTESSAKGSSRKDKQNKIRSLQKRKESVDTDIAP